MGEALIIIIILQIVIIVAIITLGERIIKEIRKKRFNHW